MTALLFGKLPPLMLLSVRSFLYALAALIAYRLLHGTVATRGLLKDRQTGGVSALRLQMLMATAIAAVSYAVAIGRQTTSHFPPVDSRLLALVGGSNGLVLIKQALAKFSKLVRSEPQL